MVCRPLETSRYAWTLVGETSVLEALLGVVGLANPDISFRCSRQQIPSIPFSLFWGPLFLTVPFLFQVPSQDTSPPSPGYWTCSRAHMAQFLYNLSSCHAPPPVLPPGNSGQVLGAQAEHCDTLSS